MKKRSKYRIVKTLTCKHDPVWYVEHRKWGLYWERYWWKLPTPESLQEGLQPAPEYFECRCTSEEMAKEKLEECKGIRTIEVIYEE